MKELSLIGSAARGEMGPDGDIDFLVDLLPEARPGLFGLTALARDLEALLGRRRRARLEALARAGLSR